MRRSRSTRQPRRRARSPVPGCLPVEPPRVAWSRSRRARASGAVARCDNPRPVTSGHEPVPGVRRRGFRPRACAPYRARRARRRLRPEPSQDTASRAGTAGASVVAAEIAEVPPPSAATARARTGRRSASCGTAVQPTVAAYSVPWRLGDRAAVGCDRTSRTHHTRITEPLRARRDGPAEAGAAPRVAAVAGGSF